MTAIAKADVRAARQRAGQIRQGIHDYLETLALIQQAWQERDWEILGYDTWDQYVETEFSEARLRLPAEHRQKAVEELRLAGMSQRAIGSTLGISHQTVSRDLATGPNGPVAQPAIATGLDGRRRATSSPPRESALDAPEPDEDTDSAEEAAPYLPGGVRATVTEPDGAATPTGGESIAFREPAPPQLAPSPAVTEFLGADDSLQRAQYLHEFMKALTRSDDFMEFEAEKLAELADLELVESLKNYLTRVSNFVERFNRARQARGGLRLVSGGAR